MKLKMCFYFLLVVIGYPSQNRGCKLENVASLSHQKNRNADKKYIQYLAKVINFSRSEESSKINQNKIIPCKAFHTRDFCKHIIYIWILI